MTVQEIRTLLESIKANDNRLSSLVDEIIGHLNSEHLNSDSFMNTITLHLNKIQQDIQKELYVEVPDEN